MCTNVCMHMCMSIYASVCICVCTFFQRSENSLLDLVLSIQAFRLGGKPVYIYV